MSRAPKLIAIGVKRSTSSMDLTSKLSKNFAPVGLA
jgi:hypothetical protein